MAKGLLPAAKNLARMTEDSCDATSFLELQHLRFRPLRVAAFMSDFHREECFCFVGEYHCGARDLGATTSPSTQKTCAQTVQQHTFLGLQHGMSAGSGFIVRDDGLVVTNAHVVSHGGNIRVNLNDGRQMRARLLAMDRTSDIALLQIDNAKDLPIAKIGSSSKLHPGDFVVALGSPLNLSNSVTCGIVSAVARHGSEIGIVQHRAEYIQTDASINVGNSGGPLIDLDGMVIGINTMKAQSADGISFAIPIDTAWQVVRQLLKHGRVARPYVGFKMVAVRDTRGVLGGAPNEERVVIAQTMPGSPADKAGVQPGDVILEFDGTPVRTIPDILARIALEGQQVVPVKLLRPPKTAYSSPSTFEVTIVTESHLPEQ